MIATVTDTEPTRCLRPGARLLHAGAAFVWLTYRQRRDW
jgi:hypothetical protein